MFAEGVIDCEELGAGPVSLHAATVAVIDRVATAFQHGQPRDPEDDLLEHAFWGRLYGRYADGPENVGFLHWEDYP